MLHNEDVAAKLCWILLRQLLCTVRSDIYDCRLSCYAVFLMQSHWSVACRVAIGGDGVFFFKTEIPGSEKSAQWGPDPEPHIHYDLICKDCEANDFFTGEYRCSSLFHTGIRIAVHD